MIKVIFNPSRLKSGRTSWDYTAYRDMAKNRDLGVVEGCEYMAESIIQGYQLPTEFYKIYSAGELICLLPANWFDKV